LLEVPAERCGVDVVAVVVGVEPSLVPDALTGLGTVTVIVDVAICPAVSRTV
jgi:hypothetical protein